MRLVGCSLWARALLLAGWMMGIWALSARSTVLPPELTSPFWSFLGNLAHAPAFGFLSLFFLGLLFGPARRPRSLLPAPGWPRGASAFLLTVGYGLLDEWHQSWVAGRHSTLSDVVLDGLAALCVLWISSYLAREDAREGELRKRLVIGLLLCISVAGVGGTQG